jgi:hypothetical protein
MKLIHRVGYYLGGFSIGLIILAFFLSGKKTSCDYSPNARTIKNISSKTKHFSAEALTSMANYQLDSLVVYDIIKYASVDFSESDTKSKGCKSYIINNSYKEKDYSLRVKNCDSIATIETIKRLE